MTHPEIIQKAENQSLRSVLESADSVPTYDQWSEKELTDAFGANQLQSLSTWIRDNTGAWNTSTKKKHTATFITSGVTEEIADKYDEADYYGSHPLSDDYMLRADSTLDSNDFADHAGDGSPVKSDESDESNEADRSDLGPIETTVLETVEQYIEIPEPDVEMAERINEIVDEVASRVDATPDPIQVQLVDDDTPTDVGIQHGLFEPLMRLVQVDDVTPYLVGEPGGGKSEACSAIADAFDLPFYSTSCSAEMSKYSDFLGIFDPQSGEFMETEFTNAIRNGGLFLLDEWDRAPAGVSVFLNSLLSNGHASLHGETIRAHEEFHFVAAGNTWMRGRSKRYSAGAQDLATVDRFAFVEWPTDEALEATLAGIDPSTIGAERPSVDLAEPQKLATTTVRDWVQYVQSIRKAMKHEETPYLASMRATLRGKKLLANGFPRDFVEDALIWRGASEDVRATVKEVAESYR